MTALLTTEQYRKMTKGRVRGKGARRIPGTMNELERAYSELLRGREIKGEVAWFGYESMTFKLAPDTRYTPDFAVMLADGTIELHECKGFFRDDARVKIKVAAAMFPFCFIVITRAKGGVWVIEEIGEKRQEPSSA